MILKIHIEQLCLQARVGILPQEYAAPQRLLIDCDGAVVPARWPLEALEDSVSYAAVAETLSAVVAERHWPLLEELIEALRARLAQDYPLLRTLELRLRKPDILEGVASVGISLQWQREGA
jgi:dihydroneopterin aldolase